MAFDAMKMLTLANNARVGMKRSFGALMTPDFKPGIEVHAIGEKVCIYMYGPQADRYGNPQWTKIYEAELPARRAMELGQMLTKAGEYLERSGGSVPPTPNPQLFIPPK